ncbi:anti-sigma 24 factor [Psychromonas sp. RZ22]|uniref:sigma-E factor negative regulatory protein n=1 Tax=Psychromonas algarum TaxID=2555643 RepID=UPI0010683C21|nr:RseA family anti-sigma factor [Psychromonas sp. RZ22]TEW53148.1 anti-sigma 24 factor [Psychromonas sp. RZ22]
MKEYSQELSALIDNELDDEVVINELLDDADLQEQFSRYQLIGDIMRDEGKGLDLRIDVTDSVMAAVANETQDKVSSTIPLTAVENNVVPFMKRFGQYAIAASVAAVVVVSSLMVNQTTDPDNNVTPVLSTVPFGGAAPVSLQTSPAQTKSDIKERNEHLEALLKDHQLQLQTQP